MRRGRGSVGCRRGASLTLVLWVIVVLGALTTGVVAAARSASGIASNYRSRVVARYAAESGVTVAVATIEERLAALGSSPERGEYLNDLEAALAGRDSLSLGGARLAIALVDVGSRLDVNTADAASLARLFSYFATPPEAERAAAAIRAAPPLRDLDELHGISGVPAALADRAAPYLTVDGDGTINRRTASDTVLTAAGGELRDEPSRILVISRGWLSGHPLTHEIQAIYAVVGAELTLLRWRERDL